MSDGCREQPSPEDICGKNESPQPRDPGESRQVAVIQQRQDGCQGVFSEQLLTSEHDDQEPDRVAQRAEQGACWSGRKIGVKLSLHHKREAHRQSCREAGNQQGGRRSLKLALALGPDRLVDQSGVWSALGFHLLLLPVAQGVEFRCRAEHPLVLVIARFRSCRCMQLTQVVLQTCYSISRAREQPTPGRRVPSREEVSRSLDSCSHSVAPMPACSAGASRDSWA